MASFISTESLVSSVLILGIGKSSVFASLICHLNDPYTNEQYKRLFPFFQNYQNFIYIDGSSLKLRRMNEEDLEKVVKRLIDDNYVVVLDEVLDLMEEDKTMLFLEQLKDKCKQLILLSPRPAPMKTQFFKNMLH